MTLESIVIIVLIGAAAGWLGSVLFSGSGLGMLGNVVVGILGSFVGSWILKELKVQYWEQPDYKCYPYRSYRSFCYFIYCKPCL